MGANNQSSKYTQSHRDRLRHRCDLQAPTSQGTGVATAVVAQNQRPSSVWSLAVEVQETRVARGQIRGCQRIVVSTIGIPCARQNLVVWSSAKNMNIQVIRVRPMYGVIKSDVHARVGEAVSSLAAAGASDAVLQPYLLPLRAYQISCHITVPRGCPNQVQGYVHVCNVGPCAKPGHTYRVLNVHMIIWIIVRNRQIGRVAETVGRCLCRNRPTQRQNNKDVFHS